MFCFLRMDLAEKLMKLICPVEDLLCHLTKRSGCGPSRLLTYVTIKELSNIRAMSWPTVLS